MENSQRPCIVCKNRNRHEGRLDCNTPECFAAVQAMPLEQISAIRREECFEALRQAGPGVGIMHLDYRDGTSEWVKVERK